MHLCLADEKKYCDRFFFHVALISEEVEREDIQEDYGRGGLFIALNLLYYNFLKFLMVTEEWNPAVKARGWIQPL